jgi:CRISPR type III-A-associated protein Csm2
MNLFEEKIKPELKNRKPFSQLNPQALVDCAEEVGERLSAEGLKNHQLRRFYDTVKQIERGALRLDAGQTLPDELLAQLLFLRPHLANAERKERNIKGLREVLDACLASGSIKQKADLTRFVKFFEAIVAYAQ